MARLKLELPISFPFSVNIPIRITDLNYGGHVGNDTILSIIHEARIKFLSHLRYTEMNIDGVSLIMGDVSIEFKNELFYGDELTASVAVNDISKVSFDLYYKLEKKTADKTVAIAYAKTGMICFDYKTRKVAALPEAAKLVLSSPPERNTR